MLGVGSDPREVAKQSSRRTAREKRRSKYCNSRHRTGSFTPTKEAQANFSYTPYQMHVLKVVLLQKLHVRSTRRDEHKIRTRKHGILLNESKMRCGPFGRTYRTRLSTVALSFPPYSIAWNWI